MNWFSQILTWLQTPAQPGQPTWGDRIVQLGRTYLESQKTEAAAKAAAVEAGAPANNAPGIETKQASEAPIGQALADLLRANGQ